MQEYIKKILGSRTTVLIISNDEMVDIIEIVKYLEDSSLLPKQNSEINQNEAKEPKRLFLTVLLGTLSASLLGIMLVGKEIKRSGDGIIRASYGSKRFSKNKYPLKSDILLIL